MMFLVQGKGLSSEAFEILGAMGESYRGMQAVG